MGLEQDIKQKIPFQNQREKALVNILFTYNWLNDRLKRHFKPYGITPTQYNILRILNGSDHPMSTFEIRERMLNKMSDITRLIERLLKKKFVQKTIHKADKRLVDIEITAEGRAILMLINDNNETISHLLKNLDEDESIILNKYLDKLREKH